jgi:hypothetical protein
MSHKQILKEIQALRKTEASLKEKLDELRDEINAQIEKANAVALEEEYTAEKILELMGKTLRRIFNFKENNIRYEVNVNEEDVDFGQIAIQVSGPWFYEMIEFYRDEEYYLEVLQTILTEQIIPYLL